MRPLQRCVGNINVHKLELGICAEVFNPLEDFTPAQAEIIHVELQQALKFNSSIE